MKFSRITLSELFILLLGANVLYCSPLHAEPNVTTNVYGDEIIIYSDDSYKPALRDFSSTESTTQTDAEKNNSGKKPSIATANSAPVQIYGAEIRPIYNSSDRVMPKSPRGGRLNDSLDTSLNLPLIEAPLSEAQTEDAHIERDDLWQRIKNGYAIPDSTSPLTRNHEEWYSSRPDYVKRMVERSQRYLFHVVEEVEKRDMPTEIALLPMIESAYNPQAYSTSHASGIWQFVPSTGKYFGLKQNWWFDNRRNITFATEAALTYLQKLHAMFGAWDLALAAYNAGEGTVSRAIERNRKLGLPTDYESLNLPAETRNYVPKLQAVKNLMTNPANYGLKIQTIANTPYFAKVAAPAQIDAHLAAKLAEISDEEFLALNPSFNRPVITGDNKSLELLLPIMSAQTFRTNLDSYNKPLVSWKTYFAKRGEKLEKIAKKFGIHVSKLRDVNDLPAHNKIKKTATILVPNGNQTDFKPKSPPVANNTETKMATTVSELSEHSLQNTDTMELAASQEDLLDINTEAENEPTQKTNVTHKVRKGEGLASVAKRYGVTVNQIMAANSLKSKQIKVGQLLKINAAETDKTNPGKRSEKSKTYTVKRGDTLHSIAEKFNVTVADLKRWNKKHSNHIQPGHTLTIKLSNAA